jgi:hypothetical protein
MHQVLQVSLGQEFFERFFVKILWHLRLWLSGSFGRSHGLFACSGFFPDNFAAAPLPCVF